VARHLFIVSRWSPDLLSHLMREFSEDPDVTVILDRRHADRRQLGDGRGTEDSDRRRTQRRRNAEATAQLSAIGYAFVRLA
jgi:hypothetical protein